MAAWQEGPDGIPIGRALLVPPGLVHEELHQAVGLIARVHGDGELPAIQLRMARLAPSRRGDRGQIVLSRDAGEPLAILIEPTMTHRVFAVLHEVGHLLDVSGFRPVGRFASPDAAELAPWRHAVRQSRAVAELITLGGGESDLVDRRHVAELLDPVEAWARGYAQYVVNRSGSGALRGSLEAFRTRVAGRIYYPQQWDDDDFAAIEATIEAMFRRLGWRRRQTF